ncbi:uncharacterized protein LOC123311656 [Coccinella septempunctata]|uniref:uncharacterized protein LOC123311656 n=1 Tax=Coccinella septempunctata TaxID=41139 RepID=UPI001D07437D|nr:uncharacterized protein LOC123311656 [Coccinella septempunctata]
MAPKNTTDIKAAIKESIIEILSDDEFINKLLIKINEKLDVIQSAVNDNSDKIELINKRMDNLMQAEKINNVCIFNLMENQEEKLLENLLKLFKDNMKVTLNKTDIARCYRVGVKKEKPRPVIVRFERYQTKLTIMKNCGRLSGTKIGIVEDLTKNRLELYRSLQRKCEDKKQVFTRNGNIYIKSENGVERKNVTSLE